MWATNAVLIYIFNFFQIKYFVTYKMKKVIYDQLIIFSIYILLFGLIYKNFTNIILFEFFNLNNYIDELFMSYPCSIVFGLMNV